MERIAYTASTGNMASYYCEAVPVSKREWLSYYTARMVGAVLQDFCSLFGHFLWMQDENDPDHAYACWPLRTRLFGWVVEEAYWKAHPSNRRTFKMERV